MILFLLACSPSEQGNPDVPATIPGDTDTDVISDTDVAGDTDTDVPEPELYRPEVLDCPNLPPLPDPTQFTDLNGFGPHEDFTFDASGNLVGVDGTGNLRAKAIGGQPQLLQPGVGAAKGTRFLPDGSVVVALPEEGVIDRVSQGGGIQLHAAVPNANGLAVDIHGNTWAATMDGTIEKVTPDGQRTVVVDLAMSFDGITFAPDYRTLYFNSEFGAVRKLNLDDDGNVIGDWEPFAQIPVTLVSILDGMTTDMCGNLYAARMDGRVYRVLPDGTVDGFINFSAHPGLEVIPAVNFGSGMGGFERDHLYAMNFLGGLIVAPIGVEGRWDPHYPIPQ